jgi:MFS family permease
MPSMPAGFFFLIAAQFASGLADNALLILSIRFLQEQGYPGWWAPLLKFSFTLSYVVLAPVMGPLSDAVPKARLMAWMNALKLSGVILLLVGWHPALAFAVVGLAASAYAPAKYGLVTESVPAAALVRANAWLEVTVVLSVILGTALGGWLVGWSALKPLQHASFSASDSMWLVQTDLLQGFAVILLIYGVAALLNAGIPVRQPLKQGQGLKLESLSWKQFLKTNRLLWRDPLGGISLYVTTLYWGVGAVMQFAVLVWAEQGLGLSLGQGAYLQALVAVGVILGAGAAGRYYRLHSARRILPMGLLLALLLPLMGWVSALWLAVVLLMFAGAIGGLLLVPMNALLQHRGASVLTAGRSVAVQGFNENASVLLMLAVYSGSLAIGTPFWAVMLMLSLVLLLGMFPVCRPMLSRWRRS